MTGRSQAPQAPQAPAASSPASVWNGDDSTDGGRSAGTGGYPTVRRGADDDPLTSRRYSREELSKTDGRSYGVARRARITSEQYAAALTEQTQTFSVNGQYQADPRATGRYPARGGQQPGQPANPHDRGSAQASYPYPGQPYPSRQAAAAPDQDEDRYVRPARPRNPGGNGATSTNGGYSGYGYGSGRY